MVSSRQALTNRQQESSFSSISSAGTYESSTLHRSKQSKTRQHSLIRPPLVSVLHAEANGKHHSHKSSDRLTAAADDIFSLTDQQLSDKYTFVREVGFGNWGSVWLCTHKPPPGSSRSAGPKVAVKLVHRNKSATTAARVRSLWNEMKVIRSLRFDSAGALKYSNYYHDSVISFDCFIITPSYALIAMPYLEKPLVLGIEEFEALPIFKALMSAVDFLHDHQITHNDIKPANVLLNSENLPVLVDFGFAKKWGQDEEGYISNISWGTPEYLTPLRAKGKLHDERKSDVWSLGITLFEILNSRTPFEVCSLEDLSTTEDLDVYYQRTVDGSWIGEWKPMAEGLENLLKNMIHVDEHQRWTALEACKALDVVIKQRDEKLRSGAISTPHYVKKSDLLGITPKSMEGFAALNQALYGASPALPSFDVDTSEDLSIESPPFNLPNKVQQSDEFNNSTDMDDDEEMRTPTKRKNARSALEDITQQCKNVNKSAELGKKRALGIRRSNRMINLAGGFASLLFPNLIPANQPSFQLLPIPHLQARKEKKSTSTKKVAVINGSPRSPKTHVVLKKFSSSPSKKVVPASRKRVISSKIPRPASILLAAPGNQSTHYENSENIPPPPRYSQLGTAKSPISITEFSSNNRTSSVSSNSNFQSMIPAPSKPQHVRQPLVKLKYTGTEVVSPRTKKRHSRVLVDFQPIRDERSPSVPKQHEGLKTTNSNDKMRTVGTRKRVPALIQALEQGITPPNPSFKAPSSLVGSALTNQFMKTGGESKKKEGDSVDFSCNKNINACHLPSEKIVFADKEEVVDSHSAFEVGKPKTLLERGSDAEMREQLDRIAMWTKHVAETVEEVRTSLQFSGNDHTSRSPRPIPPKEAPTLDRTPPKVKHRSFPLLQAKSFSHLSRVPESIKQSLRTVSPSPPRCESSLQRLGNSPSERGASPFVSETAMGEYEKMRLNTVSSFGAASPLINQEVKSLNHIEKLKRGVTGCPATPEVASLGRNDSISSGPRLEKRKSLSKLLGLFHSPSSIDLKKDVEAAIASDSTEHLSFLRYPPALSPSFHQSHLSSRLSLNGRSNSNLHRDKMARNMKPPEPLPINEISPTVPSNTSTNLSLYDAFLERTPGVERKGREWAENSTQQQPKALAAASRLESATPVQQSSRASFSRASGLKAFFTGVSANGKQSFDKVSSTFTLASSMSSRQPVVRERYQTPNFSTLLNQSGQYDDGGSLRIFETENGVGDSGNELKAKKTIQDSLAKVFSIGKKMGRSQSVTGFSSFHQ